MLNSVLLLFTSLQLTVCDLFLYLIRHGLKEDGRCGDFLLLRHEAVCQMTSVRKVESHDPAMGLHDGGVDSKVSR